MVAIQYIDRAPARSANEPGRLLMRAALAAQEAPSPGGTRPWRWRIDGDRAALFEDTRRRTPDDRDGRIATISCGASLHHALVTLAADGAGASVQRFAADGDPGLLALVRYTGPAAHRRRTDRLHRAIAVRHTDRRPFADAPLGPGRVAMLRAAAERAGAALRPLEDPAAWALPGHPGRYFAVTAPGDSRRDLLIAGEATSAVLLTAAAAGLVTSVERFAAAPHPGAGPAVLLGLGVAGRLGALGVSRGRGRCPAS
ncbi:hypothetical protein ABT369_32275 [Dactylosporangium sp. NPDC000244]|uniref:hypothetical protein n=1 Tax=Dactylosporangium sp. NPDC000244 TaxID=3154365 RepID=UPI003329188E